ncbi:MAG: thiolase C-terminal domain-containing protein, partial [Gammaproteobacteria bacterium]
VCPVCFCTELTNVAVSGDATVVACTENRHPWLPDHPPPYVIAIVELRDAPVRLTTKVVGCPPAEVRIGMAVHAKFEARDELWIPVFEPGAAPAPFQFDSPPITSVRRPVQGAVQRFTRTKKFEGKIAFTGIGRSPIARKRPESSLVLTVDACRRALDDAGLQPSEIDGLCAYPGSSGLPGISSGGVRALAAALGFNPIWHCGAHEVAGQTGNLVEAMLAVAGDYCRHVLCFTAVAQAARPSAGLGQGSERARGELAWQLPYGAVSPVHWIGLYASHYMARYGLTRESLAWIAIATRHHAGRNPEALYRDPLTLDDYFNAKIISSPFGLYDCDVPCDGALAVVVSNAECARDLKQPRVLVEAVGTAMTEHQSWDQGSLLYQRNVFGPAAHLWTRTDLKPTDVDLALLYDGFTFNVISWLEGLSFCAQGEAADFVAGGHRLDLDGELPLNPHGGQLSAGRTNGYGQLHEAVLQLRGSAGPRQVANAEIAVVSSGGGIPAGCMLLTGDR